VPKQRQQTERTSTLRGERAAKALDMAERYEAGSTLQEIGDFYGITRERVRQIIKEELGMTGKDGGAAARGREKAKARAARIDVNCIRRHGITHAELKAIKAEHGYKPWDRFNSQRGNAATRGIEWKLTFGEWWSIWQKSGKWPERARGSGYVMARHGDRGPYAPGNVKIIAAKLNSSEYIRRFWSEVRSGKRQAPKISGRYSTPIRALTVGESLTLPITASRPVYAQNAAYQVAKQAGYRISASTRGGALNITRIS
jgi:hypothetical protein